MRMLAALALLLPTLALAAPVTVQHQGRLLDSAGAPLTGTQNLAFALFDDPSSGNQVWSETLSADLGSSGYFSVVLGDTTALDAELLDTDGLYLEVSIDGVALPERMPLHSVPYAIRSLAAEHATTADSATSADSATTAVTATNLDGGVVNATEIRVNNTVVIDDNGLQLDVGPTLGDRTDCDADNILQWDGGAWSCAALPGAPSAEDVGALPITGGTLTGALSGTDASFSADLGVDGSALIGGDALVVGSVQTDGNMVAGGFVQSGDTNAACDDDLAGATRFHNDDYQVCVGDAWVTLASGFAGLSQSNPAETCKTIKAQNSAAEDGAYWLKPSGYTGAAFQAYCDMTTNGGGWTLVGKVIGAPHASDGGILDGLDATRWQDKQYLGAIDALDNENALGPSYESVPFTDFMLSSLGEQTKKLAWRHDETFSSLHAVFNAGVQKRASSLLVGDFRSLDYRDGCTVGAGPNSTGPQFYGFNINGDSYNHSSTLFNGYDQGWCSALAGFGRDNQAGGYSGGGLGAACQNRGHQLGRHYWGHGDGCDSTDWNSGGTYDSFDGHSFWVR